MRSRFDPDRLRARREALGRSREEVAVAVGRGYQAIVAYEKGAISPPAPVIAALADALDVEVGYFFTTEQVSA